MANPRFRDAQWISRAVPASRRIIRELTRDRIDWVEPGHSLSQTFTAAGPVEAVSVGIGGVAGVADPYAADVRFTLELERAAGDIVATVLVEGPQLVWEPFGRMIEVNPPAEPGEYRITLRAERGTIGWHTADAFSAAADDGVSPLPIIGQAFRDEEKVVGVRLLGVDTAPAPNPLFRRSFYLDDPCDYAILAATILGTGHVTINGIRVGKEVLEPAVTDYNRTVLYREWPVAHLLRAGSNEEIGRAHV